MKKYLFIIGSIAAGIIFISPVFAYFSPDSSGNLLTNLQNYYPLSTSSVDIIGGANGTDIGSITYTAGSGYFNNYATLNGSTGATKITGQIAATTTTVSGWFKTSYSGGLTQNVVDLNGSGIQELNTFIQTGGHPECATYNGTTGSAYEDSTGGYNDGNWHQITCENGGGALALYVDGSYVGATTNPIFPVGGNQSAIGYSEDNANSYFNGEITNIGIWTRDLTGTNIQNLYNSGNGNSPTQASQLPQSISFNIPTNGQTLSDFSNWNITTNYWNTGDYIVINYWNGTTTTSSNEFIDQGTWNGGNPIGSNNYVLPKHQTLTNGTYTAQVALYASSSDFTTVAQTITFTINGPNTYQNLQQTYTPSIYTRFGTSTLTALIPTSTSQAPTSSGELCPDHVYFNLVAVPDIGCQLEFSGQNLLQVAFIPSSDFRTSLATSVAQFTNIFPFSIYFNILNGAENALNNNNTSTNSINLPLQINGLGGNKLTLFTLTPTTISDALTTATSNTIFGTQDGCSNTCAVNEWAKVQGFLKMGIWLSAGLTLIHLIITI